MLSPIEIAGFALPLLVGGAVGLHFVAGKRRTDREFRDFEGRWSGRASLILEGRIWRSGDKRRAMVALGRDRLAMRAERTSEDIEFPLGLVRSGGIRERADGSRLLDLSLPGERFYLEVAPGFVQELLDRLSGRR